MSRFFAIRRTLHHIIKFVSLIASKVLKQKFNKHLGVEMLRM